MLLDNQWVKEEIKREIKKNIYHETNETGAKTDQSFGIKVLINSLVATFLPYICKVTKQVITKQVKCTKFIFVNNISIKLKRAKY